MNGEQKDLHAGRSKPHRRTRGFGRVAPVRRIAWWSNIGRCCCGVACFVGAAHGIVLLLKNRVAAL